MEIVSLHIAYLLISCRSVGVKGLGNFFLSYEKASFNPENGTFYPARIRINFNSNSVSGRVLVNSLQRKLKISETEAEKYIQDFVETIIRRLKINLNCYLPGIGYLFLNHEGIIRFKDTFYNINKYSYLLPMRI